MEYVEQSCVFEAKGQRFENGGAMVTPDLAQVYCIRTDETRKALIGSIIRVTDWHGNKLGAGAIVSAWHRYGVRFGTYRMVSVRFVIDGVCYFARYNIDARELVRGRAVRS